MLHLQYDQKSLKCNKREKKIYSTLKRTFF